MEHHQARIRLPLQHRQVRLGCQHYHGIGTPCGVLGAPNGLTREVSEPPCVVAPAIAPSTARRGAEVQHRRILLHLMHPHEVPKQSAHAATEYHSAYIRRLPW